MKILAIDPGPEKSAFVIWDGSRIIDKGILLNNEMLQKIDDQSTDIGPCYIEQIASYGMAVGASVFTTCIWVGRFIERWSGGHPCHQPILVPRIQIKNHLCHTSKAKDSNIRQVLIDRIGEQGTKKNPGPTYGVKADMWAALAVGIFAYDNEHK